MNVLQAEIDRLTAEIARYTDLEKSSHQKVVSLKGTRGKLITQAAKLNKLLDESKFEEDAK